MVPVLDMAGTAEYVIAQEVPMYCIDCGELVTRDRWGNLIHEYTLHDSHTPILEEPCMTSYEPTPSLTVVR